MNVSNCVGGGGPGSGSLFAMHRGYNAGETRQKAYQSMFAALSASFDQ